MRAPKPGSKRYKEIVARGCGGYRDYWGEYDCHHYYAYGYSWACDDCPIVHEKYLNEEEPCEEQPLDLL